MTREPVRHAMARFDGESSSRYENEAVFATSAEEADSVESTGNDDEESKKEEETCLENCKLPLELQRLINRFVESLARTSTSAPSIEVLSDLYQNFYAHAEARIASWASLKISKQQYLGDESSAVHPRSTRKALKSPSVSPRAAYSPSQQLLTPEEVKARRKARRILSQQALSFEEAAERQICERTYNDVWQPESTSDKIEDDSLYIIARALIDAKISLKDLDVKGTESEIFSASLESKLQQTSTELFEMDKAKSPRAKLECLFSVHKIIIDLLSTTKEEALSSSADEILPTLIFILIRGSTLRCLYIISNLRYIQRFRAASKMDGEAAYCLTNLEAAITFLQTVDLDHIRREKGLMHDSSGKHADFEAGKSEDLSHSVVAESHHQPAPTVMNGTFGAEAKHHEQAPQLLESRTKRISNLFQPPATAIVVAEKVVRDTADHGIKTIGGALEASFGLLFGRLVDAEKSTFKTSPGSPKRVPRTLQEVKQLVEPRPETEDDVDEDLPSSVGSTPSNASRQWKNENQAFQSDGGMLNAIVGRRPTTEGSENKLTAFEMKSAEGKASSNMTAVESVRHLSNTFNPLKTLGGGINVMRNLGRMASSESTARPSSSRAEGTSQYQPTDRMADINMVESGQLKTLPPMSKFLEMNDVSQLAVADVPELLSDYKRLAEALRLFGAF